MDMGSEKVDRIAKYLNKVFWSANWRWTDHARAIIQIIEDCDIEEMERRWEMEQERGYAKF